MIYFNPYLLATAVTLSAVAMALGIYTLVLGNRLFNLLIIGVDNQENRDTIIV